MILVADDDASSRAQSRAVLGTLYTVIEAEDGQEALELAERIPIDLALLDVVMPALGGLETCRRLKAASDAFLPVVLLTGLAEAEHRIDGLAAGADEVLAKPIASRELLLRVRSLLRQRTQEALFRHQLAELEHLQLLKDELFALIVHDLRSPLSGVVGFLELLQGEVGQEPFPREQAVRHVSSASRAAERLTRELDTVLEVQRLEEAGVPVAKEPVRVNEVLEAARAALEGASLARDVAVEVEAEQPSRVGFVDPHLVRRAVENLLANAVKVSERGSTILLRSAFERETIVIEVADRGPGLTNSDKHRLTGKFLTQDRRRGFGLGLHLVKLVSEAHGGRLAIGDRPGGGASFRMELPDEVP